MARSPRKFRPGVAIAAVIIAAAIVYAGKVRRRATAEGDSASIAVTSPSAGTESGSASVTPQSFDASNAIAWMRKQVEFGPRIPGSEAHKKAGDLILGALSSVGAQVQEQAFLAPVFVLADITTRPMPSPKVVASRNLIGSLRPAAKDRILLAAHWDSRARADKDSSNPQKPAQGAIDGASGVGVLLEIARVAAQMGPDAPGIDFLFFDNEDQGIGNVKFIPAEIRPEMTWCLGSQFWQDHPHFAGYKARLSILLDMVGAREARYPREGNSVMYASEILEKVWKGASALGYSQYFVEESAPPVIDDHVAVNRYGVPMVDIIDMKTAGAEVFPAYHHTHRDSMERVDPDVVRAVGQTVLQALLSKF